MWRSMSNLKASKSSIPQKPTQAATRQTGQSCPSLLKDLSDKRQKCLARKDWECDLLRHSINNPKRLPRPELREHEHIARCWGACCQVVCYTSCHSKYLKCFAFRTPAWSLEFPTLRPATLKFAALAGEGIHRSTYISKWGQADKTKKNTTNDKHQRSA